MSTLGKHFSEEIKRKMSESLKEYWRKHPEIRKRQSERLKKNKLSTRIKAKISKAKRGQHPSEETRKKLSEAKKGEKHPNWKGGITAENIKWRQSLEYKKWRMEVFKRDYFICQSCNKKFGLGLVAHHIKSWSKYPELRLKVDNGITLCRRCHAILHHLKNLKINGK